MMSRYLRLQRQNNFRQDKLDMWVKSQAIALDIQCVRRSYRLPDVFIRLGDGQETVAHPGNEPKGRL